MFNYIEKLRNKPEHIRRRILLGSTISITAIVALIWFSVSYVSLSHSQDVQSASVSPFYTVESNFAAIGTAFSQEKAILGQTFSGK